MTLLGAYVLGILTMTTIVMLTVDIQDFKEWRRKGTQNDTQK